MSTRKVSRRLIDAISFFQHRAQISTDLKSGNRKWTPVDSVGRCRRGGDDKTPPTRAHEFFSSRTSSKSVVLGEKSSLLLCSLHAKLSILFARIRLCFASAPVIGSSIVQRARRQRIAPQKERESLLFKQQDFSSSSFGERGATIFMPPPLLSVWFCALRRKWSAISISTRATVVDLPDCHVVVSG